MLGFSIYALVDGQTVSNLVEEGAEDLGESISVDIYKSSAIILIIASSIIVITSFLGCCGAIKVRLSFFIYKTQCVRAFSNPIQKVHGLFHFYIAGIPKTDQNQLKKPSAIRLPKQ